MSCVPRLCRNLHHSASALLGLPAGTFAGPAFRPLAPPATLTGTGVNAPFISAWYINWANLSVK